MENQHPIFDKMREKGMDFEFKPTDSYDLNLFTHRDGHILLNYEYRDVDRELVIPLKANDPLKRAWNRLLRMVREDKRLVDHYYEHGAPS